MGSLRVGALAAVPHGMLGAMRRASVLRQTLVGMTLLIILAVGCSSLPALGLIHAELERQAWDRVEDGATTTLALLQAELDGLADLARLAGERPSLRSLVHDDQIAELETYLAQFSGAAGLDQIVVRDAAGEVVAGASLTGLPTAAASGSSPSIVALPGSGAGAALLASSEIVDEEGRPTGDTVTLARLLDEQFLSELGGETGLHYSLLSRGQRVATTLPSYPADEPGGAPGAGLPADRKEILAGSAPFYVITTDIVPAEGLQLESALPVAAMKQEEQRALLLLGGTTLLAVALISALGFALSRWLARPLDGLTRAAQRIRQGDLETPVPIPDGPCEIAGLASMLEAGRVHTRATVETLLHEKAWSESLIQSVVEGIVTLDRAGRIATFSPGAERLIGWRAGEAIGQAAGNVFRTPDGSVFVNKLPPPGGRRAVQVLDRSGRTMTLSVTDARFRLPSNGGERLALVMRDVSDDEAVRQLRSYFLANISHEFRTPLSAIHASVELLLEDLQSLSKDEIGRLLHSVDLSVTGLQTLIDNLLESLSIEAGRFTIRRHASSLDKVIDQSVRVMRPLLDRREQSLQVHLPAALPSVWMDPMRVTQVIVNLLSNASKYSPVRTPIDLSLELSDGETVRISVADRGEGIAAGDRENLFRRFVRLEPADPGQYGVGLGLSVVKAIIEEHGGRVGVEARPGGGSIFWFTLPLQGGAP